MIAGIDTRSARRFNLAGFVHVAGVMDVVQTGKDTLPVSRRIQCDLTIDGIEKRHHLRNGLYNMTIAIENHDIVCHFEHLHQFD